MNNHYLNGYEISVLKKKVDNSRLSYTSFLRKKRLKNKSYLKTQFKKKIYYFGFIWSSFGENIYEQWYARSGISQLFSNSTGEQKGNTNTSFKLNACDWKIVFFYG